MYFFVGKGSWLLGGICSKMEYRRGSLLITILLCDDHAVVRKGLKLLLNDHPNMKVIGEASEGNEAIRKSLELRPNVIIMDLSMPGGKDGLTATSEIKEQLPDSAILILTMHEDEEYLYRVIQEGASGIVLKSAPHKELIDAIHAVHHGDAYLYPAATKRLVGDYLEHVDERSNNTLDLLTN